MCFLVWNNSYSWDRDRDSRDSRDRDSRDRDGRDRGSRDRDDRDRNSRDRDRQLHLPGHSYIVGTRKPVSRERMRVGSSTSSGVFIR